MVPGPLRSERVVSWARPSIMRSPVTLWAEMSLLLLLMRAVTGPVMALSSISPWLAVTVTGLLRAVTLMSPWLAVTVEEATAGTVMVTSARPPSMDGTERLTLLPLMLRLGLRRWALA